MEGETQRREGGNELALASLSTGLASLLCWCPIATGLTAVILGILHLRQSTTGRGLATIGIVTGSLDGNPNCNLAPTSSTIAIFRIFRDTDHESPRGGCREADGTKRGRLERRHSKGFDLLYADGHVKWATRTRRHWWTRMADENVFGGQ
jgi:prepilin-type processing-associated H-X9-DG protein